MDQKDGPSIDEIAKLLERDPDAIEILPDGEVRHADPENRNAPSPLVLRTRGIGGHY